MAATVTSGVWAKAGAWALDSEQHEEELLHQHNKDETTAASAGINHSAAAPLADFPSLSIAASTKTKKKKAQTFSLSEFKTYDPSKAREAKLTHVDMMMLPTGPRERTAEELERNKLGGGFRSYGNNSDSSRWGSNNSNSRGSDEPRRQGSFGRDSDKEFTPSRADETDDWGAGKKSSLGGGFERRERGERGWFFDNSQSRADDSDSWVSNKSFVPSEGRRYERQRVGFESNGGGADSDNWGKKKEEEGRKFGAFDSLRERRGGGFDSGNGGGAGADNWGKKREEVGSGGVRPKLNLQPRKLPVGEEQLDGSVTKPKGSNPFGDARPREEVLKEKGQDWKVVDEKLESLKLKEKEAGLTDVPSFGNRSFGSGNGRASGYDDRSDRSWRKTDAVEIRLPPSSSTMTPSFFSLKTLKLKTKQQELLIRVTILCLVYILAFITRLFSVLRYESMIHEFDPYFNYRTTLYLTEKGFYDFWNWFDSESWYPLGRIIGGTLYPGLMVTAAIIYWVLRFLSFAVHIREVCVLTAPFFASNTTLVAYFFGKELWDSGAGLVAAALIAICPGYISRSVAGSYDNEGVAIFALLLTFYMFVKAVNTGSLAWSLASAFGYFYMVSAWGGYVFIINLVPLYVLVLLITGRYSMRLYVAYNCMYILGMLLAMQIRFVGFQHVQSGEHMAAMGVFFLMQVFYFLDWVKHKLNDIKLFQAFLRITVTSAVGVGAVALGLGTASGYISPWTGRFYSLLDPTYAKDHIPIIASVSEHQPTAWSSFMFDFHILLFLFPAGLYFCFKRLSDATIFIVMYGLTSMYFAGVMVRLILVATPAVCLISAIAVSATIKNLTQLLRAKSKVAHSGSGKGTTGTKASSKGLVDQSLPFQRNGAIALLVGAFYLLSRYVTHCTWVTSEAYSSPSIVLAARGAYGQRIIFDDYREAYFWLRQNTPQDAKVMSWWDYGYQITAMGNRTVIVDNNTWNNTHIATVGRAMSSYEDEAYEIMRSLDVDYVLVVFGGVTGYSSDDINKFLWMVRIGGGVFPVIKEPDYLVNGEYRVDKGAAPKMLNCLMYKLCYYRFGELTTEYGKPPGYDRARGVEIGNKDVKLEHLEEAFTTSNWIVRIYKVKPPNNRW